jgi:hypothetical protein
MILLFSQEHEQEMNRLRQEAGNNQMQLNQMVQVGVLSFFWLSTINS